ncbi:MAG: hypothetical protein J6K58_09930 [Lachnospiraceae bacterium]|nr:hypothetical protein [Lachnospiraceae bacterium]
MTIQNAYLTISNILNDYYLKESKNDSLVSLLSDMDTNIFSDGEPADIATYEDWYNVVKGYEQNNEIKNQDINLGLTDFLIYYQKEFGHDFEKVIKYIQEEK